MAISTHAGKDIGRGVIEVKQNVAGVALLGIGQKIDVITLLVTCAQKAHHRSTYQLTRIPHSFSWTRLACDAVNQADEVESIRHGRELAADSIPGKKESAIEHGDENAIEAPPNYNEVSVNGNNPLNSVSQSRGALQQPLCPCFLDVEEYAIRFSASGVTVLSGFLPIAFFSTENIAPGSLTSDDP
jgi:hypothetical protein